MNLTGHANTWYHRGLREIKQYGQEVTSRGGRKTWEVLHAVTTLPHPRKRVLTIPWRRANPFFQALEPVWILSGRSDAAWICRYNKQLRQFLDPGSEHFHGAYGERIRQWGRLSRTRNTAPAGEVAPAIRDQLEDVVTQLQQDPTSRRAAVVLRNPNWDNAWIETLDMPCNIACTYQLRGGRLHAATFNRSNDFNLGLSYTNLVQFTTIQEFIAQALGADDVGVYTHFSSSLHVYEDDAVLAGLPTSGADPFDVYDYVQPVRMSFTGGLEAGDRIIQQIIDLTSLHEAQAVPCDYWRSIALMKVGWEQLYDKTVGPGWAVASVVDTLGVVPARDWQIACLEYVHRWAVKRNLREQFIHLLDAKFRFGRDVRVRDFIMHDTRVLDG